MILSVTIGWKPDSYHHCSLLHEGLQPGSGDMPASYQGCRRLGGADQSIGHRGHQMQG